MPMIGAQVVQFSINATDIAMVGRIGAAELAATALATNFHFLVYMFGSGFLVALSPIVAQAYGRGDERAVRRTVRMGLWFALAYGILCLPALFAAEPALMLLGQKPELAALAGDYMAIAAFGMLPSMVYVVFRSFLGAIDRAGIMLWASIAGVIANAGLNWVFIFGNLGAPAMGVPGAALASVITGILMALIVVAYGVREKRAAGYQVLVRFWRADWPVLWSSLALGLPISLTIIAEVGLFQMATLMAGWLGVVPLAAHSIVMQLISFSFMVPLGLGHAATVRVGQEIGAGSIADAERAGRAALATGFGAAALTILAFVTIPGLLIGIFLPADDPLFDQTLAAAIPLLMIGAAFNLFDGAQAIGAGNLRGIKDTKVPMVIAVASYWALGIPAAYALAFNGGLGAPGIWLGLAAGLCAAALLMNMRFFARIRAMPAPAAA
jgi:MATE family multidrug resistance protein